MELPFAALPVGRVRPFVDALPIVDLQTAAALSLVPEAAGSHQKWMRVPEGLRADAGMFVAQIRADAASPSVLSGAWCVFRQVRKGTDGKLVVVRDGGEPRGAEIREAPPSESVYRAGASGLRVMTWERKRHGKVRVLAELVSVLPAEKPSQLA